MANSTTSSVYIHVIEDVVDKVREEFISSDGPGEIVLNELQVLWEMKMMQAGVILGPITRNTVAPRTGLTGGAVAPVHDLNVPYEGFEEYVTPTADMLFPPTPLQTPLPVMVQTPVPGTEESSLYNIPTGSSEYATQEIGGSNELKRPSPYMQSHTPWMNQRPRLMSILLMRKQGRKRIGDSLINRIHRTSSQCHLRKEGVMTLTQPINMVDTSLNKMAPMILIIFQKGL